MRKIGSRPHTHPHAPSTATMSAPFIQGPNPTSEMGQPSDLTPAITRPVRRGLLMGWVKTRGTNLAALRSPCK